MTQPFQKHARPTARDGRGAPSSQILEIPKFRQQPRRASKAKTFRASDSESEEEPNSEGMPTVRKSKGPPPYVPERSDRLQPRPRFRAAVPGFPNSQGRRQAHVFSPHNVSAQVPMELSPAAQAVQLPDFGQFSNTQPFSSFQGFRNRDGSSFELMSTSAPSRLQTEWPAFRNSFVASLERPHATEMALSAEQLDSRGHNMTFSPQAASQFPTRHNFTTPSPRSREGDEWRAHRFDGRDSDALAGFGNSAAGFSSDGVPASQSDLLSQPSVRLSALVPYAPRMLAPVRAPSFGSLFCSCSD